jgi:flavin-dependent dehydrogenase
MGDQGLENITVAGRKHFECRSTQEIEYREDEEAGWNAKEKSFNRMMSKRAEVESAEKIAGIGADTARDEGREAEVARTEAFEGKDCGGVS